jgi:glucose-1-phosphate thymidylyltransferase
MKVVIPVAGEGRRLRPHTYSTPKCLLQVAGKPILGHIVDQILELDFSEIIFVTGPSGQQQIEQFVRSNYDFNARFIAQEKLYGLGYAVYLGIVSRSEDLLIVLGDTIVELDWQGMIAAGNNTLVVKEVADPRAFGVVETAGDRIVHLVEKPEHPPTNLAVVGVYYIKDTAKFFDCITEVIEKGITTHGEIQVTDAFDLLIKKGSTIHTFPTTGWYDCGQKETILSTNRFLLDRLASSAYRDGSVIISPSYIAPEAVIENSVIGPYASIGKNSVVRNSIVRDSIIADQTQIVSCTIEKSLIGNDVMMHDANGTYNLGDYSEVGELRIM